MIISHNVNALNSYNELNANVTGIKKSSEKLSSGYRINHAADDAAGLAVSEKMRSQIRGLVQATRNAQDGVNFVQTAEGALGELHSVLQRCKELATESANGTYSDAVDRDAVQLEIDRLRDEVEHIAMTDFNGRHCFEVEGSGFLPAYDRARRSILFAVQGVASGTSEASYSPAQLVVDLDNNEKVNIEIKFDETTFFDLPDSEIDDIIGKYSGTVSRDAVKRFAEKLKNNVLPAVLAGIAGKLPKIAAERTKNGIEIGLDLYVANSSTLASVTSSGNSFKLSINMNTVEAKNGEIEFSSDLWGTLAHEMTHAVMFDATSSGMIGTGFPKVDKLPSWFSEGSAEAVGGGMDRLRDLLPWRNSTGYPDSSITIGGEKLSEKRTAPATIDEIKTWMKKLTNDSPTGDLRSYEQGYAATMYLSWLAGGGTGNASTPINSATIANGLDKILTEVNSGKSLSQVIDETTGTKYKGLNDFVGKINAGDDDIAKFLRDFITATGAVNDVVKTDGGGLEVKNDVGGSIIAPGGLGGSKDGLTTLGGSDGHFTLILEKNNGGNIYGTSTGDGNLSFTDQDELNKYKELFEGGGATKNSKGEVYVEGSADTTGGGGGTDPVDPNPPGGGGGTDPVDPNPPGGGGGTDPVDPNPPGGGGGTDPVDPNPPGGGGGTDPVDPNPPGGGGGTDPVDPNPPGGGTGPDSPVYVFIDDLTPLKPFVLQVGTRSKDSVNFTFSYSSSGIGDLKCDLNCTARGLGLNDISVSTQSAANEAIDKLDLAINKVSLMRATFGAIGNRLERKIDNLTTVNENISEAESHIRDTDMATEIMGFTKGQILQQAAQSMLTQANQLPQGVLQLLS